MNEDRVEGTELAERFHETYDRMFPRGGERVSWQDMPESYRKRLSSTFESMIRTGKIQLGPFSLVK